MNPFKKQRLSIIVTGIILVLFHQTIQAQEELNIEFGKLSPEEYNSIDLKSDSGAGAIILANVGRETLEMNEAGNVDVVFRYFTRIKIIGKNGFDAGQFALFLNTYVPYHIVLVKALPYGLISIKGSTFNMENGALTETKLDPEAVYTEKLSKDVSIKKFAMPSIKEGSVFDVEFTIRSSSLVQDISWNFQNEFPCRWSEYNLTLSDADRYKIKYLGDTSYYIHDIELAAKGEVDLNRGGKYKQSHFRWVKRNEPAIRDEAYVFSMKNYSDRISFEHEWIIGDPPYRYYTSSSWEGYSTIYYILNGLSTLSPERHGWMKKDVEQVMAGKNTTEEKARAIFYYVRDHFKSIRSRFYFTSQSLKETYENKSGNNADINLLLTAMLRYLKIDAEPAILSTSENGHAELEYPIPEEYNYMICIVKINGKQIFLDASNPNCSYGILSSNCYNGGARTLNTRNSEKINLTPESVTESSRTNVFITSDENHLLTGGLTINCSHQKSYELRKDARTDSLKSFFTEIRHSVPEARIKNEGTDDLGNPDLPVTVHCDLDFKTEPKPERIYFDPVVFFSFQTNPFNERNRKYPVELPYKIDNVYLLNMDIPKGYRVEEMPESSIIRLNDSEAIFEYTIEKKENDLQLQMRIRLNKTYFTAAEYSVLQQYISSIQKKESQRIVLQRTI